MACQGVAAICAAVLAGLDGQHDLMRSQHGRHGQHAARQRLAQHDEVGLGAVVVTGKLGATAPEAALDLVSDQEHLVPGAQLLDLAQIAFWRHDDPGLPLDGLHHKCRDVGAVPFQLGLQRGQIAVGDVAETGHEWPETCGRAGVVRRADGGQCPAPEVVRREQDPCLTSRDALDVVSPAPRELDRRLATFDASVHREHAIVAEELRDEFSIVAEAVVVKRAGRQRQPLSLVDQRSDDLRMAMPLVDSGIR
mmetsp:Transcript_16167/g.47982  ORF Transcript_16167/g.47982 Transcript_16167/m.47982 type:complete len:251 (+) Transcript_16167:485-1237(+)